MRRAINILALVFMFTMIAGCEKNKSNVVNNIDADIQAPEIEIIRDETTSSEPADDSTEDFKEQPYSFKFVDAFGEEYETTIQVDFPKTNYINDMFGFENGKTLYEDDTYYTRHGIDVSGYQGKINWDKVKASGVEFAILRLGFRGYGQSGTLNLDKRFADNISGACAAGLDIGVYIFSQAINEEEAIEEAEFVLKNIEGYELTMPIVYDPESILDDVARTDNVTAEQFTKNTIAFCERIKEAGFRPMVYSNMLWEAFNLDMEKLNQYSFWYADYEKLPQTPYAYEMWQYSSEGNVDGVSGPVDLDIQFIKK